MGGGASSTSGDSEVCGGCGVGGLFAPDLIDTKEVAINHVTVDFPQLGDVTRRVYDVSRELRNDRDVAIAAVRCDGLALNVFSASMRNDFEVVLTAVSNNGEALLYASMALRKDREIIVEAIETSRFAALRLAHPMMVKDESLVAWANECRTPNPHANRDMVKSDAVHGIAFK